MSDALFSTLEVDTGSGTLTGYRLQRLEVYNWGTFDKQVWTITPGGMTSLLTGDIGTGKSTLVDAITTLLLPAHRISYNKAAGADARERTLRSYVEGHYRSSRDEATGTSRAVTLRDHRSYSVLLGVFSNEGYGETVTLAQVFHQKDRAGQPDRFYITSSEELSIAADFTDFGDDLRALRRRLRNRGVNIDNSFPDYGRRMRRVLGIRSEQAMELFHQTVSMKSVGNLTDFVRNHMLEPADASGRIAGIISHFDDLTRAYEAVQTATEQLALLDPLVASADKYEAAAARRETYQDERQALVPFAATRVREVIATQVEELDADQAAAEAQYTDLDIQRAELTQRRSDLIAERASAGGDRLAVIETELQRNTDLAEVRARRKAAFDARVGDAGLAPVATAADFRRHSQQMAELARDLDEEHREFRESQGPLLLQKAELAGTLRETRAEITSLTSRRNNIPTALIALRERLCEEMSIDESELPFAGELIDVAQTHEEWRGAAERVLRPFALTLLVSQDLYRSVSTWVNHNHLGTRLVYRRVPDRQIRSHPVESTDLRLLDVLDVEPGEFETYVIGELARRADHHLVAGVAELERTDRAVTREGLVRDRDRHEKDDRRRADDPRAWVLGRRSETKLAALRAETDALESDLAATEERLSTLDAEDQQRAERRGALAALSAYTVWEELDASVPQAQLAELGRELGRIRAGSTRLAEIETALNRLVEQETQINTDQSRVSQRIGAIQAEAARLRARDEREQGLLTSLDPHVLTAAAEHYPAIIARARGVLANVEEVDSFVTRVRDELTSGIDTANREMNGHNTAIVQHMMQVLDRWPELRSDMDANIESINEFRALHEVVKNDDLPRFEAEFHQLLNVEATRELASFNQWLRRQSAEISLRVEKINEALGAIDYNPGRRITLIAAPTVNQEIRAFHADMRSATGDLIGDGEGTLEQRFEQVRTIIERFKGRPGHSETDRAWTARVSDVRNWYTFGAAEIDRDTGEEFEHYTDSDGKSGGQKEKLAYTILAASLAYQFGLEWGVEKSQDFRFVVIDEAFGRGSDESTRYALDLFAKLGLQLLIVTPLQKVHVIEPYVDSIGYVDNTSGAASRVHSLTIEEYRSRRGS